MEQRTLADRKAAREQREAVHPVDPLAGLISATTVRSLEDRRGNPQPPVEVTSYFRKGSAALVAQRVADGVIQFVPTPPPAAPQMSHSVTVPRFATRSVASQGTQGEPVDRVGETMTRRMKKHGTPARATEPAAPADDTEVRARLDRLEAMIAGPDPVEQPDPAPAEPPPAGRRRRRAGE
jgi:hypothetical protein